jgi:hypothetical protein
MATGRQKRCYHHCTLGRVIWFCSWMTTIHLQDPGARYSNFNLCHYFPRISFMRICMSMRKIVLLAEEITCLGFKLSTEWGANGRRLKIISKFVEYSWMLITLFVHLNPIRMACRTLRFVARKSKLNDELFCETMMRSFCVLRTVCLPTRLWDGHLRHHYTPMCRVCLSWSWAGLRLYDNTYPVTARPSIGHDNGRVLLFSNSTKFYLWLCYYGHLNCLFT